MASPGRFHSSGNCFQPITGFLLTFINWPFSFFFLPLLQPQHPHSSLGWKGFPDTCPGAAAAGLGVPQSQGKWRTAAHGASSHSPSPWGGGSGLVEEGSVATGGHTHGNFPNIYHYYTGNKTCGKSSLVLGWGQSCLDGWGTHLRSPPSHLSVLHQPGTAPRVIEIALSPGTIKAGQIAHEPGELCPHSPSCSHPCGTSRKKAQPQHLPVTQNHPGKERMGTHQQLAHRAALERSHFPFAAQITCCSTSGAAAPALPVPNTPPLAPAGTSHLVPAWIAPRADKKLQLMLLAGGKGVPAVPNNPGGEGKCQKAAGLL